MSEAGLLNFSTKVSVAQTVGEVLALLTDAGADEVATTNVDRRPVGVRFLLTVPGGTRQAFALPVEVDAVMAVLRKQLDAGTIRAGATHHSAATLRSREHAEKVAWRIARTWLQAQLALVEAHMVTFDQVMLPYMLTAPGQTLYQRIVATGLRELGAGDG